jgi:hypothetical protein
MKIQTENNLTSLHGDNPKGFSLHRGAGFFILGDKMDKKKNLTGIKRNKLKIIEFAYIKNKRTYWKCLCDCGNYKTIRGDQVMSGNVKSCGCLNDEKRHMPKTHGLSATPLYNLYLNIIRRCFDNKTRHFKNYGGRGISICENWLKDRNEFFKWAIENGYRQGLTLDRIDNNGNYSPNNCQFITRKKNNAKRRITAHYKIKGKYFTSTYEAAEYFNVSYDTIRYWCGLHNKKYPARIDCEIIFPYR